VPNLIVPKGEPAVVEGHLRMGDPPTDPDAIGVNSRFVTRRGAPWLPVTGEFHFSRYPVAEWREELVKMRGGGITVASTYVVWILHEECRGIFDWTGARDLRHFLETCADVGLDVVLRIGPWAHGEFRNGGFPNWLSEVACTPRTDDPAYLELVRVLYGQIADQVRGLLHAQGGPVVAIQVENELYDQPEHLMTLKRIAVGVGLDAPLWTATGWGHARLPAGEILPVFGGYPEAAWDTAHDGWARQSRAHYFFGPGRDDDSIGADLRGGDPEEDGDETHLALYPYATCEVGGGMYISYHRRPLVAPEDIAALALVKIGSGSVWQGYYMYHGGSTKIGRRSTLQESHATGYPNDCLVVNYDFQAPLGEYGQVRPSYALLRLQHMWLADHGPALATMPLVMPEGAPEDPDDRRTLRWAVRTNGDSGYLFVNNHQPVESLPDHNDVQFALDFAGRQLVLPASPAKVPRGAYFVWPLAHRVAGEIRLSVSAQPLATLVVDDIPVMVLFQTADIEAELQLDGVRDLHGPGRHQQDGDHIRVVGLRPGVDCRLRLIDLNGQSAEVLILDERSARRATRGPLWGRDRLALSRCPAVVEDGQLRLYGARRGDQVLVFPPADSADSVAGVFSRHSVEVPEVGSLSPHVRQIRGAGLVGPVLIDGRSGRASAPTDADYDKAASVVHVDVPAAAFDRDGEVLLRIDWTGDAARAYVGDVLVADQFWYGRPWDVGLRRFQAEVLAHGVQLRFLPLREDAPIYLSPGVRPGVYPGGQALELRSISLVRIPRTVLGDRTGRPG
jgi:hypothetical protein